MCVADGLSAWPIDMVSMPSSFEEFQHTLLQPEDIFWYFIYYFRIIIMAKIFLCVFLSGSQDFMVL